MGTGKLWRMMALVCALAFSGIVHAQDPPPPGYPWPGPGQSWNGECGRIDYLIGIATSRIENLLSESQSIQQQIADKYAEIDWCRQYGYTLPISQLYYDIDRLNEQLAAIEPQFVDLQTDLASFEAEKATLNCDGSPEPSTEPVPDPIGDGGGTTGITDPLTCAGLNAQLMTLDTQIQQIDTMLDQYQAQVDALEMECAMLADMIANETDQSAINNLVMQAQFNRSLIDTIQLLMAQSLGQWFNLSTQRNELELQILLLGC